MTPEQRVEWLAWRRGGLGGSDVASVLGLSPWSTPWQVWRSKVGPVEPDTDRPELATGRRLEGAVLGWMCEDLGVSMYDPSGPTIGREPWMRGTADGIVFRDGGHEGIEAKTSRDAPWDQPPIYYETQCRHYMAVYGIAAWHLGCYFKRHDEWRRWTYTRDLAIERRMVDTCRAWWKRHVVGGEPPPVDASDACRRWQHEQHADPSDEWAEAPVFARGWVEEIVEAKRVIRANEAHVAKREAQLRQAIGDAQGVRGHGMRAKWSRWTTRRLDTKALRRDHPDLAEKYTTETPTGRLTVAVKED